MSRAWPADTAPPAAATPRPAPARSGFSCSRTASPRQQQRGQEHQRLARPRARRTRAAGRRCAPPAGRCRGPTGRSPRSRRRASPRCRSRTAAISRSASRVRPAREQDAPQPGQEQQPRPDRAIEPRQQQHRAARTPAAAPPSRRRRCRCAAVHGCYSAPPPCRGQSACYVSAPLLAGAEVAGDAPAQAHYLGARDAPRGRATTCCCSTARDGEWRARIADRPAATARALPSRRRTRRSSRRSRSAGWLFALLKRDATDLVGAEGDRTRRHR